MTDQIKIESALCPFCGGPIMDKSHGEGKYVCTHCLHPISWAGTETRSIASAKQTLEACGCTIIWPKEGQT